MNFSIKMKSYTHAQKARLFLAKRGVRCFIERSAQRGAGCGYSLIVVGQASKKAEVCALLREIGVQCDIP